jgi:hypothetical protein
MALRRLNARLTATSAILGLAVVGTAGAAVAAVAAPPPPSASNCGTQYNYTDCVQINGSGTYISL